jgi:hypothetical protein
MGNWTKQNFSREEIQMAKEHMKKCSPSLAIKEIQIKTTLSFNFTPIRIAIIKTTTNNRYWWGSGEKETLIYCWWECKLLQPLWKTIWRLIKKLNIDLPYDPTIPILGIYPKDCDSGYSRGTCTPIFIAVLFTVAKIWKQQRCPSIDKWIKKIWYLYNGILLSHEEWNLIILK